MTGNRKIVLATILAFSGSLAAHAADQTILGNQLQLKNPSTPDKRKAIVKAKEKGSPNTIVGNPVTSGATLSIAANGGSPSSQLFVLPTGNSGITGKPFWSGDATKGFKYKDSKSENGPVKSAQIKKSPSGVFSIKAVLTGKVALILVLPPNPGVSGCAALSLNLGDRYSVAFGVGDGIVTNKGSTLYKHKKVVNEAVCPIVGPPTTVTPTTTPPTTGVPTTTPTTSTTTTTLYGSPSRAFMDRVPGLLD
jgi:hypothetical protein